MVAHRVSVICIFRNEERFLAEAIESVLKQEFSDFELFLVDDGSTDRSPAIAREFAARRPQRISYLEHPGHANRGMAASRNLGIRHASGEYLAFLDGDDRWRPRKLADQVAALDSNPEVGVVCGAYTEWRSWSGGRDTLFHSGPYSDRPLLPPETTLQVYPLGWANSPQDIMVRRSVVDRVGGFEEGFARLEERFSGYYDDQLFLAKVYLETGAMFLTTPSIDYRRHPLSSTARLRWIDYIAARRRFLDWFESYIAERPVPGKDSIERSIHRARRKLRHRFVVRATRRIKHGWLKAIRHLGFADRYRRHSASN